MTDHPCTRSPRTERVVRMQQLLLISDYSPVYASKLLQKCLILLCGIMLRLESEHCADLLGAQFAVVDHFALGVVTAVNSIHREVCESSV